MKNVNISYQHYLSEKEKKIKINLALRSSLQSKLFSLQKQKRNFSLLFSFFVVGFAVFILVIFPLRYGLFFFSEKSHPTFLQEVHAAYADMKNTLMSASVVHHTRIVSSRPSDSDIISESWTKFDGSFSLFQQTKKESGTVLNRVMIKEGNTYVTKTQAEMQNRKGEKQTNTSQPKFDVSLPEGTLRMIQTYDQSDPSIQCIDLVHPEINIQDVITLQRSIELLQTSSWNETDLQKMQELIQDLETNPHVQDLGEQTISNIGLVHGFRLAFISRPEEPSKDSLQIKEQIDYYFDTTTYRLKKWTKGDGTLIGTTTYIIQQDELVSEQDIPSELIDPIFQNFVLLPKMDVQSDTRNYTISESGCYRFGPYPKWKKVSIEEEKMMRENFTRKHQMDIKNGFQYGTSSTITTLQTTLTF